MSKKILFVHAYWQRCGNNFFRGILSNLYDAEVPVDDNSEFPFPLLMSKLIRSANSLRNRKYGEYIISCGVQGLISQIKLNALKPFIIVKNTSFAENLDEFIACTSTEQHFVLIRDPRDVMVSYIAAMKRSLQSSKSSKDFFRLAMLKMGYYHLRIGLRMKRAFVKYNSLENHDNLVLVHYEELLDLNDSVIEKLRNDVAVKKEKWKKLESLPVYNTSFKEEIGAEKTWAHNVKTDQFSPTGRWKKSGFFSRFLISRIIFRDSFLSKYNY